jgi:hypothetical protein
MTIEFDDDLETCEFDFRSPKEKKMFLARLVQMPYTSTIGNDKRLLTEIETWMNL